MKIYFLGIIFLFFLGCATTTVYKDPTGSGMNGYFWNSRSELSKTTFIAGYVLGQAMVREDLTYFINNYKSRIDEAKNENEKSQIEFAIECMWYFISVWNDKKYFSGVSASQAIEGVDNFYNDYANKHIKLHHAFSIVAMRFQGHPEESVQALISFFRVQDAKK